MDRELPRTALDAWISALLADERFTGMGHAQRPETRNLGLGWLYYALARLLAPTNAVVIGSHRGFVPLLVARALADEGGGGRLVFIDPSLVDDFWRDPQAVREHFAHWGLPGVEHHGLTTQDFVETDTYRELGELGLVFIDGYHSKQQAAFDFRAFESRVGPGGLILLHDSIRVRRSSLYGPDKVYEHRVCEFIDELRGDARYQVFDLPFGDGLTLVRKPGRPETLIR